MGKKILIIKNDKIGDMIFASGVFREIKKKFPSATIDVVASPENIPIIEKNKNIRRIYSLRHGPRTIKEFYNYFLMSRKLRKEKYDVGIELRGSFFNKFFLLLLSGVKYKTGFYIKPLEKIFLDLSYKRDLEKHECWLMLDLINKSLNMKSKNYWPDIAVDKKDVESVNSFMKKNKLKKFICIVPEASIPRRQWPLKNAGSIIKFLRKNYPKYKILLVGRDTPKIRGVLKNNPSCIPIVDKNLREVYLLFKKSDLSIVIDAGPMHLAWASKTKLIVMMTKYLIEHVKPLGKNSIVIAGEDDKITANDLDKITVKEVENKIDKLLKKH